MIKPVPPAFIFILGAMLIPLLRLRGNLKQPYLILVSVTAFIDLLYLEPGTSWVYRFLGYDLVFAQVDRLSLAIGYIFVIIGFLAILYSLHVKEDGQHVAAFLYVGGSLGVVFAGDYFSLFAFWEIMAVTSVFLIWYRREKESLDAGFRYVFMHIFGGCSLLTGIIIHIVSQGFTAVGPLESDLGSLFILIGFGLNAAFIPLHTWLPDSYPQGTVTGSVFLSVYTTKTGVYVLARCFSGADVVAYMGGIMAVYGVLYALLQNDTRKLLSYHIISQVGYMVAGIGVGTALGVNGGIAHLVNNILYKSLLFMCMGSVIYMTGKRKLTELGGLAKLMPVTCIACIIASLSISGGPGFNGFVSKGMVISSAAGVGKPILELMLILASVGTFLSFTKLCYFTFFVHNEGIRAKEAPFNMQLAMILTAFLCVFIGVYPRVLFSVLPYHRVYYHPYTPSHVVGVLQLFLLAGWVFMAAKAAFSPHAGIVLDFDYFYRMTCRGIVWLCMVPLNGFRVKAQAFLSREVTSIASLSRNPISIPAITKQYVHLMTAQILKYNAEISQNRKRELEHIRSRLREIKGMAYNENTYRGPMGLGILLALIFLFFYGLIYFLAS
ncbi:MAG: Na(+)/H(+) antiporter subunit D [Thermodesulfobacteriota bacterium]